MCMSLGTEPDPKETPPDYSDLMDITKVSIEVYNFLPDIWDGSSGFYQGKDYSMLSLLFDIYEINTQEAKFILLQYIKILDKTNTQKMNEKVSVQRKSSASKAKVKKG